MIVNLPDHLFINRQAQFDLFWDCMRQHGAPTREEFDAMSPLERLMGICRATTAAAATVHTINERRILWP